MKIVFLSNYFTHHQKALSDALAAMAEYSFVSTAEMTQERKQMGWGKEILPEYVCFNSMSPDEVKHKLQQADVVIAGSAPEELVRKCILDNKLVFRYHERPLKNGVQWLKYLPRWVKWHIQNPPGKRVYMLCASAFTAGDYERFGLFRNKMFRWGYFPEQRAYPCSEALIREKQAASVLWAGRLLDWKHPDDAVLTAEKLKNAGIPFRLDIIGNGPMEDVLRQMIERRHLGDCVHLLGAMEPEKVRWHMEQSEIFLFTSDRREGWGAVLNEAMNSGCAVVASHAIGAVPFLLKNGENGMVYRSGDTEGLYDQVRYLLEDPQRRMRLGRSAMETIAREWNGEIAASRLLALIEALKKGTACELYDSGPCSPAKRIRDDWYGKVQK